MFLKSIEMYGFKSFADKTRLEFAHGTTSLLGPNGCGKSNIVDAIKWVLGEQSTKTLRAGKMEDVIFNGTEKRSAMSVAEVTLVINNELNLLPTEHSEVEIKRRLFRSGESEFYINRQQVRLKDIRELFFDTGVGKSAYSILEQGKIDQILSHKPEDRRYIFEEAAGITRFKKRSEEAGRKLQRTEENIDQVETLLSEVKRQYDSRKGQAAKAQRYKELESELLDIEVKVQLSAVRSFVLLREKRTQQLTESEQKYEDLKELITKESDEIKEIQQTMHSYNEQKMSVTLALQRLEEQKKSSHERITLLTQRYHDFIQNRDDAVNRGELLNERLVEDEQLLEDQEDKADSLKAYISEYTDDIKRIADDIVTTEQMLVSIDKDIEEKEEEAQALHTDQKELSDQIREITDTIVEELENSLRTSGFSKEAKGDSEKELISKIDMIKRELEKAALLNPLRMDEELETTGQKDQLGSVLDSLESLKDDIMKFSSDYFSVLENLTSPQGAISTKRTLDKKMDQTLKDLQNNSENIVRLRKEKEGLNQLAKQYRTRETELKVLLSEYRTSLDATLSVIDSLTRQKSEREFAIEDALNDKENAEGRMEDTQQKIRMIKEEQDQIDMEKEDLSLKIKEIENQIREIQEESSQSQRQMQQHYDDLNNTRSEIDKYRVYIESLDSQIQNVYHQFYDTYGKSLKEYEDEMDLEDETDASLRERQTALKNQIQQMGYINHMAAVEFEEIKERYDFLTAQLGDLRHAKTNLEKVLTEITERSEELFLTSYQQIRANFHSMFHRMFAGGRAELRLVDPDNPLTSGIDIFAQPPGKKLDRLAPLSGGEKSLTAVALLFATYKVKPSPFCILDEIDAALDDRNIGYFLNVLQDFSKTSQFIIITHNKHTVMGSQTLLGVTMQEKGVSKAISYKMGWEKDEEVIHDAHVDTAFNNTV
ncbi:MAG: AAA family ATPase [Sphaerochaetaceae bacterium]|nr:AAA family ATPase [Sphaerochaetaceae bacterium]MDC7247019.1 AAA family ATPase [Sphaerochaetaceae bacterium]